MPQEINIGHWTRWGGHRAAGEQLGLQGGEFNKPLNEDRARRTYPSSCLSLEFSASVKT